MEYTSAGKNGQDYLIGHKMIAVFALDWCIILWMSVLTLNLPTEVSAALAEESRQTNRGQEEVALDLLQRALAVRRFRAARQSLVQSLGDQGPDSEEDIYNQIS
jgi:hypothetical protein